MSNEDRKILVVDDHPLIRQGVKDCLNSLGFININQAASKSEALAMIAHTPPDLIILDVNLPDGSGFEVLSWVTSIDRDIRTIILSFNAQPNRIRAAMSAGANAYLLKGAPLSELENAITHVFASPDYFLAKNLNTVTSLDNPKLSIRELQVLSYLMGSESYIEIAKRLFISLPTLKSHVSAIFSKLEVNSRLAAVNRARELGLV